MKSYKPVAQLLCGLLVLTSCQQPQENSQLDTELSASQGRHANLGQAYDSRLEKVFRYPCVQGNTIQSGTPRTDVTYHKDLSRDEIRRKLALEIGISFGVGPVSLSPAIEFADENSSTELSSTQTVVIRHQGLSEQLNPNMLALSNSGKQFAESYPNSVYQWCGDEFIQRIDYGASLVATLKYTYSSASDKKIIGGKIGVDAGLSGFFNFVGLRFGLRNLKEKAKERTLVEVSGIQIGGQPELLSSILPSENLSCRLNDIEPCLKAFNEILEYAKTEFPNQLTSTGRLVPIQYSTLSYEDFGESLADLSPKDVSSLERDALIMKVSEYREQLSQQKNSYQTATEILKLNQLSNDRQLAIQNIKDLAFANSVLLESAIRICRTKSSEECQSQTISLQEYDSQILSLNYGAWYSSIDKGDVLKVVLDDLPDLGVGDDRTIVVLQKGRPGRRPRRVSAPAKLQSHSTYIIQKITRQQCLFPSNSVQLTKGCEDERHSDSSVGFKAAGFNEALGRDYVATFFNADLKQNEISIWGFIFSFDPETGEIFTSNGDLVGRLEIL
ncbi:MAG: hypothetical protein HRU19_06605 [Pseudobacteriovorax sp.]|nr:hypothetical protein [Pseudobacteriovorax sp.]